MHAKHKDAESGREHSVQKAAGFSAKRKLDVKDWIYVSGAELAPLRVCL
jgi:hypothetical protein